jgi:hypothetical protein
VVNALIGSQRHLDRGVYRPDENTTRQAARALKIRSAKRAYQPRPRREFS